MSAAAIAAFTPYALELLQVILDGYRIAQKPDTTPEEMDAWRNRAVAANKRLDDLIAQKVAERDGQPG